MWLDSVEGLAVLPRERTQLPDEAVPVVGRAREERAVPLCPLRGAGRKFPKAAAPGSVNFYATIASGKKPLLPPALIPLQRRERHRQCQRRHARLRPRWRLGLRIEAEMVSPPHGANGDLRLGVDTYQAASESTRQIGRAHV